MANPELRYHIELVDEHGNAISLNNLDRQEVSDFNSNHAYDDLDYVVVYDRERPQNVTSRKIGVFA